MRAVFVGMSVVVAAVLVACGGSDRAEDAAQRVLEAMDEVGMVYHAVAGDIEVWLDIDDQVYRSRQVTADRDKITIGEGWLQTVYDPLTNAVSESDESLPSDRRPRIDDPAINWLEALGALAFAQELELKEDRVNAEGASVTLLEARSPIVANGVATGATLVGRLELDPETFLLVAFERREDQPIGATPNPDPLGLGGPQRVQFVVSELIPRSNLGDDFFSTDVAYDAVLTFEDKIENARALGIEPYWLGDVYEDGIGSLVLQPDEGGFIVDEGPSGDTVQPEATFSYTTPTEDPGGQTVLVGQVVIIKLWPADRAQFAAPIVEGYTSNVPEGNEEIEINGEPAALIRSFLTPPDLACPEGLDCPDSDAPLYHRIAIVLGETAIQLETHARVDPEGVDRNPYNSAEGITALAEALTKPS
ncbi:MAG: hypothetical protein IH957_04040 [Chloroflexi bacterium]|nr:hypothetical protein [Chloroflexota bacterium]